MSAAPVDNLELRALEQRERIHKTALELMSKVDRTKEQLSATNLVREHFGGASAVVSALAFVLGYAFAGIFTRE
jgi:hypothetical protein